MPMASNGKKPNGWKNRHFYQALRYAVIGLITAYQEERNVRFHTLAVILVVVLGRLFNLSSSEWLWIILAVFSVLSSEIWNSALENVVDLATGGKRHPLAKKAKDMAAGAVLLAAIFALIVAAVIFLPKFYQLIYWREVF